MYTLDVNEQKKLIKLVAVGFFGVEEATKLSNDLKAAFKKFKKQEVNLLYDLRELKPSSAEIIPIIQEIETLSNEWSNKFASIYTSSITKMQMQRTYEEAGTVEKVKRFTTEDEAMKYLFG